jgi:hypothetical protein
MTAAAAAEGQWQLLMAKCGAGVMWPEVTEMGIKGKWEQYGYDRQKILINKNFTWVHYTCTLQSPVTSMFLVLSWPVVIISSGLWQACG